jgi:hypothetical protein
MFPVAGTVYILSLQPEDCPLLQTCKAPNSLDAWWKVEDYVLFAAGCALASSFAPPAPSLNLSPSNTPDLSPENEWQQTVQPYILRKRFLELGKSKQLSFQVIKSTQSAPSTHSAKGKKEETLRVKIRWEWIGDAAGKKARRVSNGEGSYEWVESIGGNGKENGKAKWDDGEGEVVRALRDVVEEAGRG